MKLSSDFQMGSFWTVWEMLEFEARKFVVAAQLIATHAQAQRDVDRRFDGGTISFAHIGGDQIRLLAGAVRDVKEVSAKLGLYTVLPAADRVWRALSTIPNADTLDLTAEVRSKIRTPLIVLNETLADALESFRFYAIKPEDVRYVDSPALLFGSEVLAAFPSLAYEIEEAAQCYAMGRSTAAAFHAIRCLEAGIRALSRCLGIPDPTKGSQRSWMRMLSALQTAMKARWPDSTATMSGDGKLFEEAHAALAAMQNPYRNNTMHLDAKFTQEEANHILTLVGGFMRKIAGRMNEDGQPLA